MYFLIHSGEDGLSIKSMKKEELLHLITPDEHGDTWYGKDLTFLNKIPECENGYFYNVPDKGFVIISGKIVVPKPLNVVTKYELPE